MIHYGLILLLLAGVFSVASAWAIARHRDPGMLAALGLGLFVWGWLLLLVGLIQAAIP